MAPYKEGFNKSVDQKDCPPELKVTLKGKANEWQDRAKEFNKQSFEDHKTDISDITKAVDTFVTRSTLENIALNADDKALLKYMRALSVNKPIDISIMQTMLRDVCDKTIAIDGRIGDQTIAAMKLAMEKFTSKIPGHKEGIAIEQKINALTTPVSVIDTLSTKIQPIQGSPEKSTEQAQKNMNTARTLLQEYYKATGATMNEKGALFVRKDIPGTSDTQLQQIATIDLSKSEDTVWDNIRVALEEYKQKVSTIPIITNHPEFTMMPITPETNDIPLEKQWGKIQGDVQAYALAKGYTVTFEKTNKFTKAVSVENKQAKDSLRLNQFYVMNVTQGGKSLGSQEFTLGADNMNSPLIKPDLQSGLQSYIDTLALKPAFEVKPEAQEQIDKTWYDGFDQASKYAQEKGYKLTSNPSEFTTKNGEQKRPSIDKSKQQQLFLVNTKMKEIRDLGTISLEKIHLVSIMTSQEITTRIQALIDASLARRQENPTSSSQNTEVSEKIGDINVSKTAIAEFKKLGIFLQPKKDGGLTFAIQKGKKFTLEADGIKSILDITKDSFDSDTASIDYKDGLFTIKNKLKEAQILKITDITTPLAGNMDAGNGEKFVDSKEKNDNQIEQTNIIEVDNVLSKLGYSFSKVDGKSGRKYISNDDSTNSLSIYGGVGGIPKDKLLKLPDIISDLLDANKDLLSKNSRAGTIAYLNEKIGINMPLEAFDGDKVDNLQKMDEYAKYYRYLPSEDYEKMKNKLIVLIEKQTGIQLDGNFSFSSGLTTSRSGTLLSIDGIDISKRDTNFGKVKSIEINFSNNTIKTI